MYKLSIFLTFLTLLCAASSESFENTYQVISFQPGNPVILPGNNNYETLQFTQVSGAIPYGTFQNFPNTLFLTVQNKIDYIEPWAFYGLTRLKTLDLSWNEIRYLKSGTFSGVQSLENLILKGNDITYIEGGTFYPLQTLVYLDLNYNDLFNIMNNTFSGLSSLQALNLERNKMAIIESQAFEGLESLRNISLRSNILTRFPVGLMGIHTLEILDISYNWLPNINNDVMTWMTTKLKLVDISGNPAICEQNVQKGAKAAGQVTVIIRKCV